MSSKSEEYLALDHGVYTLRLYYVRWNTFGSVPPLPSLHLDLEDDRQLMLGRQNHRLLSLSSLVSKAERSSSPPPYDDPPPYHLAVQMWGAPDVVVSQVVTV